MAERKYVTPDFSTSAAPTSTLAAANPIKKEEVSVSGQVPSTSIAPEAKMVPDTAPKRIYVNPVFTPEVETTYKQIEPKDIIQLALSYSSESKTSKPGIASRPDFITSYTLPTPGKTDDKGVFQPYTDAEIIAHPLLGSKIGAEKWYREHAVGDTKGKSSDQIAQDVLYNVYETERAKSDVADPIFPIDSSPEAQQKYQKDLADAEQAHIKADAMGKEAVAKVKDAVSKGMGDYAKSIIEGDSLTVGVYDPTKKAMVKYRAMDSKAASNVAELEKISPLTKKLEEELADIGPLDMAKLNMASATFARVYAKYLDPNAQVSMGNIDESKMSTITHDLRESGGLNGAGLALAVAAVVTGKMTTQQAITEYGKSSLNALDPQQAAHRMKELLEGAKQSSEKYKKSVLHGYGGVPEEPGQGAGGKTDAQEVKPLAVSDADFLDANHPQKGKIVLDSVMRWNKKTSLSPEEVRLGIKDPNKTATGENEGVAAFQSYLKTKLGATKLKVTGIPNEEDGAALQILIKQNPKLSAKDIIHEALTHKAELDGPADTGKEKPKGNGGKSGGRKSAKGR